MVNKRCAWGKCNSDSRYAYKDHMKGVNFVNFPSKKKEYDKCRRWANACYRKDWGVENVTRHTFICTRHFVGGNGPTEQHPDPINAGFTEDQVNAYIV